MTSHPYTDEDYDEVIEFLEKLYRLDRDRPYWLPGRWEYATYLCSPLFQERGYPDRKEFIRIVRDGDSIVGLINSENPDHNAYVHTHPDYRYLEDELIAWAEKTFKTDKLSVWSLEDDAHRTEILKSRGYQKEEIGEYLNWCDLKNHEPRVSLPGGYTIASFKEGFDISSRIDCSAKAFNSNGYSKYVYYSMQQAPSYDPALDLVIKEGEVVVSLCTIWTYPGNNLACFEPVATAPEHQRKGLGIAILNEGMKKLKERNIKTAYVGSSGDWRKSFYCKAGFTQAVLCRPWTKRLR